MARKSFSSIQQVVVHAQNMSKRTGYSPGVQDKNQPKADEAGASTAVPVSPNVGKPSPWRPIPFFSRSFNMMKAGLPCGACTASAPAADQRRPDCYSHALTQPKSTPAPAHQTTLISRPQPPPIILVSRPSLSRVCSLSICTTATFTTG